MTDWTNPNTWRETYRDPVSLGILAVDLFPAYAVIALGWDATALVFLYWLENLVIGAVTLAKMVASSVADSPAGLIIMAFMGPFFTFHYGMFCFVHGIFVYVFANMAKDAEPGFPTPWTLIDYALGSGYQMPLFIAAIILLQAFLFATDFIGRGQFRKTAPTTEMTKPYGRIIVLHFGLFVGMAAMIALGEPMLGILALIALRAIWGMVLTIRRHQGLTQVEQ